MDSSIVELANVTMYAGEDVVFRLPPIKDDENNEVKVILQTIRDSRLVAAPSFMYYSS